MIFEEAYERYSRDIRARAWMQHVPGLDYDDVVTEMMTCLWRACQSYKAESGPFPAYWWSVWLNHRSNLVKASRALKRPAIIVMGDDLESGYYMPRVYPDPPTQASGTAKRVWVMIAEGVPVQDILSVAGITKHHYYRLLSNWKTDAVRDVLYD